VKWLLLLLGGGIGAVLRFALALWVDERAGVHFPWGTLAVNVVGCFGIGVVATLADEHTLVSPGLRLLLVTGLLGGFTTFSTFGIETWQLVEDGHALAAMGNALASLGAGLAAVIAGVNLTRAVV
jgi:CrcB protein